VSKAGDSFDNYLKEVEEYGKKLGINPKTWEAEWEYAPYVDPVLANGRNFVSPGLFAVGGGVLDTKMVQSDMAAWLSQLVKNMASAYTPQGVAQLKATSNGVLRLWKTMTTVTRPTFLIRNLVGGVWNNQIIGVRMRDYSQVRHGMIQIRKALRNGRTFDQALNAVSGKNKEMFRPRTSYSPEQGRCLWSPSRTSCVYLLLPVGSTRPT
jgi:hypothetical protein